MKLLLFVTFVMRRRTLKTIFEKKTAYEKGKKKLFLLFFLTPEDTTLIYCPPRQTKPRQKNSNMNSKIFRYGLASKKKC